MTAPLDVLLLREVVEPARRKHELSFIKDLNSQSFHHTKVNVCNDRYDDDLAQLSIGVQDGKIRILIYGWDQSRDNTRTDHWDFSLGDPNCIKKAQDQLLEILG
jgi:hypothetical protein